MTFDTTVKFIDMGEFGIVGVAFILIATLGQGAILGHGRRIVVNIAEAKFVTDRVGISDSRLFNKGINAHLGLAPLVTFGTARLITQTGQFNAGRHDNAGLTLVNIIMTGYTLDSGAGNRRTIDHAGFAAVSPQIIQMAGCTVTLGAIFRDFRRILLIPMNKGFRCEISMGRSTPFF